MKPTHKSIIAWNVMFFVYYCFSNMTGCRAHPHDSEEVHLVDLSHTFDDTTIYWVTQKKLNFTVLYNGTAPGENYWYQSDEISAGTHGGTHMDSPCHFALGAWCITDIPLKHLVVSAVVVDISTEVGDDPNVHLTADHLKSWEQVHGKIPDNSLLLIRTGWSRFWPDPLTYSGTTERNASLLKFPSISGEAAKWLIANRNIVGIGIDVMSIDIPGKLDTHTTLYPNNIYGLENVNLVEPLPPTGIKVYVMPMKLKGASGAPCRVFAEVPDIPHENVGSTNWVSRIWIITAIAAFWTLKNGRF
jgi:kynurenine formamidase